MAMAKVILIANQKGGVGKTTLSFTAAAGLVLRGNNVLLLDADSQRSSSNWRVNAAGTPHEKSMPWVEAWDNEMLGAKVSKERPNFDYILLDTAGGIGHRGDMAQKILVAAIKAADHIVIPMGPSPLDVDGSEDFIQLVKEIWARFGEKKPTAHIVINGVRPGTVLSSDVSRYVMEKYSLPVLETQIQMREAYRQGIPAGATIFQIGDKGSVKNANAFVDELLAINDVQPDIEAHAETEDV